MAVIRDERDSVICEDPERPGRRKVIPMRLLSSANDDRGGGGGGGDDDEEEDDGGGGGGKGGSDGADTTENSGRGRHRGGADTTAGNKKEIPVPTITTVRRYDRDVPPNYDVPMSYVRYIRPTYAEAMEEVVEYDADAEDEKWWRENEDFGPYAKARIVVTGEDHGEGEEEEEEDDDEPSGTTTMDVLPLPYFERMMDALEKATGHESIVTISQAEEMLVGRMPILVDIFGPLSEGERRMEEEEDERYLKRWLRDDADDDVVDSGGRVGSRGRPKRRLPLPTLAPPVTLPEVIRQVYDYWMAKRSRLRKPLLRRYWPPTSASDLNPHQVFRQRDKEKRRLRKKRQNDIEAYKKMRQLRMDFERVGTLCELILKREEVNSTLVELTNEYFEERMHGWTDTTGLPRRSRTLNKSTVQSALSVPKYFDDGPIVRMRGGNKRKRGPQTGWKNGNNADTRDPSPVPLGGVGGINGSHSTYPAAGASNNHLPHHRTMKPPPPATAMAHLPWKNIVIAGHDGGFPAPNFLQPLASRESHFVSSLDDVMPSMPSYVNGACTTSHGPDGGFRHRPRLGRGGRIIIDRVPRPSPSSFGFGGGGAGPPAPTVVTYGSPMGRCGYHVTPLGADGPNYAVRASGTDDDDGSRGGGPNVAEGGGTDARTAPKAPPARSLVDLLPKSLGDVTSLSQRIKEICAMGLMEDYQAQGNGNMATAVSTSVASSLKGVNSNAPSSVAMTLAEEMDEVLVPIEDWMEAPEGMMMYGSEKFVIGPL
ncbi:hypothetical protein ACHAW5_005267 [Stephanodiscus triporus]|uniref:Enhancer of polycomb-like protein n=1 Tax=Stephanodiscus triporus TaxID=2934178 RepID=A0ABD3PBJ2_9STRA